jgi:hypothetical protein
MLRFKILASVLPLAVAALFARGEFVIGPHPCIAVGETSVRMAAMPWQAQQRVTFTADPAFASVRVQITDTAETADFAVIDDINDAESGACESSVPPQLIAISDSPGSSEPVIYLSPDGPAEYRIFVRSRMFSARDAAALIVGARGKHHMAAAEL